MPRNIKGFQKHSEDNNVQLLSPFLQNRNLFFYCNPVTQKTKQICETLANVCAYWATAFVWCIFLYCPHFTLPQFFAQNLQKPKHRFSTVPPVPPQAPPATIWFRIPHCYTKHVMNIWVQTQETEKWLWSDNAGRVEQRTTLTFCGCGVSSSRVHIQRSAPLPGTVSVTIACGLQVRLLVCAAILIASQQPGMERSQGLKHFPAVAGLSGSTSWALTFSHESSWEREVHGQSHKHVALTDVQNAAWARCSPDSQQNLTLPVLTTASRVNNTCWAQLGGAPKASLQPRADLWPPLSLQCSLIPSPFHGTLSISLQTGYWNHLAAIKKKSATELNPILLSTHLWTITSVKWNLMSPIAIPSSLPFCFSRSGMIH